MSDRWALAWEAAHAADPLAAAWWQVWGDGLYRREGARRALLAAYEQAELERRHEASLAEAAAHEALIAARQEAGRVRMAELAAEVRAAGGRDRWVYLQRLAGRKFKDIAADMGCAASWPGRIFKRQMKRERQFEHARQELARAENEVRLSRWVRDVWLKYPLADAAYIGDGFEQQRRIDAA